MVHFFKRLTPVSSTHLIKRFCINCQHMASNMLFKTSSRWLWWKQVYVFDHKNDLKIEMRGDRFINDP